MCYCASTLPLLTVFLQITYRANAARSDRRDPQRPVAIENAKDVPGLMTILNRLD